MAQTIKHKRSSITSTTPLTTQLVLGELAINTFDGDVFLKKDNGTESIIKLADDADLSAHTTSTSNPHSVTYTQVGAEPANANIQSHISSTSNPHSVTYTQVGAEPANANIQSHIASTSNPHSVTYTQVGAEPANANIQSHIGATNPHSGSAASGANTDITSVLLNQTGLVVKGATANALTIKPNETLTAGRTLNIITGDADRTLTLTGDASISGTHSGTSSGSNSGDQTITLTGGVTGSGTGSFAATVVTNANLTGPITSVGNATTITNSSVTLAHQADIATASFMGRNTAGTGVQEVLSIATAKTMLGLTGVNSGDQTITLTGDVTGSGTGSFATTYNNAVPTTKGGTGNGFTKFSGPTTSEKTFTLPDATSTILTTNAAVTVAQGGTGVASTTAYAVQCGGTTSTGAHQAIASVGTSGQVLTSNGAGALPTFQTAAAGGGNPLSTFRTWVDDFMLQRTVSTSATYGAVGDLRWNYISGNGNGSSYNITSTSLHPGVIRMFASGTNATCILHMGDASTDPVVLASNIGYFACIVQPKTTTTGTFMVGLGQNVSLCLPGAATWGTDGVWFKFDPSVSPKWQFVTSSSSLSTTILSGSSVSINTWYLLEMTFDGTTYTPYINGTALTTSTTNKPTVATNVAIATGGGFSNAGEVYVDYFAMATRTMANRY